MAVNTHASVVEHLRTAILAGHHPPGDRITEGSVVAELGVSRTPVREAFLVLEAEGVVELQPGRGARVRVYEADDLEIIHETRSVLEGAVARRATRHVSDHHLDQLRTSCDRLQALPGDPVRCNEENTLFHGLLFDIVGSERLTHIARRLLDVPLPYKRSYWMRPQAKQASEREHRAVYEAIAARDGAAAEAAMADHVRSVGRQVMADVMRTAH